MHTLSNAWCAPTWVLHKRPRALTIEQKYKYKCPVDGATAELYVSPDKTKAERGVSKKLTRGLKAIQAAYGVAFPSSTPAEQNKMIQPKFGKGSIIVRKVEVVSEGSSGYAFNRDACNKIGLCIDFDAVEADMNA